MKRCKAQSREYYTGVASTKQTADFIEVLGSNEVAKRKPRQTGETRCQGGRYQLVAKVHLSTSVYTDLLSTLQLGENACFWQPSRWAGHVSISDVNRSVPWSRTDGLHVIILVRQENHVQNLANDHRLITDSLQLINVSDPCLLFTVWVKKTTQEQPTSFCRATRDCLVWSMTRHYCMHVT